MTCCQWVIVRFCHLPAHSKWRRRCLQSRGSSLWVCRHSNQGTRASCLWFSSQPSFHTNSSSTPSMPENLWSCQTILKKAQSWRGVFFRGAPVDLPGTKSSSGSMPLDDVLDGSMSQTHVTCNSPLPHALTGKCNHFRPNAYRGWTGHY